jgi:hypothetical protein
MNVIKIEKSAFRIPEIPLRYRANCHGSWGMFVPASNQLKNMNIMEAKEAGLTRGKFVEMAVCFMDEKILTFEPHYSSEPFKEIWGFPVQGEIKDELVENCSQLVTFLLHRQSRDRISRLVEEFSKEAFNAWVAEGMTIPIEEYAQSKINDLFFTKIFRFEMIQAVGDYGPYYFVETTFRDAATDFERAALKAAAEIHQAQLNGLGWCNDPMLEANHSANLSALSGSDNIEELPPANTKAQLKAGKSK